MKCCINDVNFIRLLLLSTELFKFEIQKYGQILCVHKPCFLMPGHILCQSAVTVLLEYFDCLLWLFALVVRPCPASTGMLPANLLSCPLQSEPMEQ